MFRSLKISWYSRLLLDKNARQQIAALRALGQLGARSAIEPVIKALENENRDVRLAAATVLGQLGDARAFEALIALGDRDKEIYKVAIESLGKLGDSRAFEPLLNAMKDGDHKVRLAAVVSLGLMGDARAVEPLLKLHPLSVLEADRLGRMIRAREGKKEKMQTDGDRELHAAAATALIQLGAACATEPLINALEDILLRQGAVVVLGQLGDVRAIKPLTEVLGDFDGERRISASVALSQLGQPQWSKWIKGDADDFSRLGASGDFRACDPLIWALEWRGSTDIAASTALGQLGDTRAVDPLLKALCSYDKLRQSAATALAHLGEPQWSEWIKGDADDFSRLGASRDRRIVEPLIMAFGERNGPEKKAAAIALGQLGDIRAVEPLISALDYRDWEIRRIAVNSLGQLKDIRAFEPIRNQLGSDAWEMRLAAATALGLLGDGRAIEFLITALGDERAEIRVSAAVALGQLGQPQWSGLINGDADDFSRLGASGDCRAFEPLIKALRDAYMMRPIAAAALGRLGDVRAVEPLCRVLEHFNRELRLKAATALGLLGDTRAVKPLIQALVNADGRVRLSAAVALGLMGQPQWAGWVKGDENDFAELGASRDIRAVEPLIEALGKHKGAAIVLGQLGDVRAVEPLIKLLTEDCRCEEAAVALGQLGDLRAVEPLIKNLSQPVRYAHEAAVVALGQLGDVRAIEPLITAMGRRDTSKAAALALGRLGALHWSQWVKGDADDFVRLGTSGDDRAIVPLLEMMRAGNRETRQAAATALGLLGQPYWVQLVKVADEEFLQLVTSHDASNVAPLIKALSVGPRDLRKAAAAALIRILLRHPKVRIPKSREIFKEIQSPHHDVSNLRYTDFSGNGHSDHYGDMPSFSQMVHSDSGLGLPIPRELLDREF